MNILVTGGAGFIGSHLVDDLIEEGHKVYVYDNLDKQVHKYEYSWYEPEKWPKYLNKQAIRCLNDVRGHLKLEILLMEHNIDIIFHFAAKVGVGQSMCDISEYVDVNVGGTAALLNILANKKHNVKKLIVASSMSNYGEGAYKYGGTGDYVLSGLSRSEEKLKNREWDFIGGSLGPVPTSENKVLESQSIYALTKKMQEEMCLSVGKAYNIPTVALRFFNVYGTRQSLSNPYTGVAAIFCSRLLNDKSPIIYEDGEQLRDFVHVKDVCSACKIVMNDERANYEVFNVGSGESISIKDISIKLAKHMGKDIQPEISNKYRIGDIRHCYANIDKLKNIGYVPKYKFEDSLDELVSWVKQQNAKDDFEKMNKEMQAKGMVK